MRTRVVIGFCVLAVGGVIVAVVLVGFGGTNGSGAHLRTTGAYAPLIVPKPRLVRQGSLILNELDPLSQSWTSSRLSSISGNHRYAITITNASNMGYINSFEWYPPTGVQILKVIGSTSGHCAPSGLTGFGGNQFKAVVLYPNILCEQADLRPPSCTCTGDGGSITISFVLDRATEYAGATRVLTTTPVLKIIPTFLK